MQVAVFKIPLDFLASLDFKVLDYLDLDTLVGGGESTDDIAID
jgi:hypothetical protein